jgi:dienelactone hydrolase
MTEIVLFHHVQGLTPGVIALGDRLAEGGYTVHTPDLFAGRIFDRLEDGFAFMQSLDPESIREQVDETVGELPDDLVYAGISWGVKHAQRLAQTRPGARGALLFEACFPVTGEWAFGPWPTGLPVQVHGMDQDEFFALEGDLDAARELVANAGTTNAAVFTYPGDRHLFTDSSLPSYDELATKLTVDRARKFLGEL